MIYRKYNLDKIKLEIDYIMETYKLNNGQLCFQSVTTYPDFNEGCGKLEDSPHRENEYIHLNIPETWEISKFITDNNLTRTRLMTLNPKECYSVHQDSTLRLHLAVVTDPSCKLVVDDRAFHIPADGYPRAVDTTKLHTAFNGTFDVERIHIVGCIK